MRDFTVLVLEGAYSTSVAITLDMLAAAATLAARFGVAPPKWKVCSIEGGSIMLEGGVSVDTVFLPRPLDHEASVHFV